MIDLRVILAIQQFFRRYKPPSTGITPVSFRAVSPITESPSRAASVATSAEEAIYRRPIGPQLSPMSQGFTEAQLAELRAMIAEIHAPISGPPGPQGEPGATAASNDADRFHSNNVGFFDPFYDSKSVDTAPTIKHSGKSIYFRDIHVFIDRIKDVTRAKNDVLL